MKLNERATNFDVFGDEYSDDYLVVVEDLDNKATAPCLVFGIYSAGYGGENSIEFLGKFDYMEVLDATKKVNKTWDFEKELKKLNRLDLEN